MDVYIRNAALLCEDCAQGFHPDDRDGPFPDGGGEADAPQHCDLCDCFLENPLTSDGEQYVRDMMFSSPDSGTVQLWREFYSHINIGDHT